MRITFNEFGQKIETDMDEPCVLIAHDACHHVYPNLKPDGTVELDLQLSDMGPLPVPVIEAIEQWQVGEVTVETTLSHEFTFTSVLDNFIDLHEMGTGGPIDSEAKPLLDAMLSELVAMVDRINKLRFKTT